MNPNARISALEAKLAALTMVIEKQNRTQAVLEERQKSLEESVAQHREYFATLEKQAGWTAEDAMRLAGMQQRLTALEARLGTTAPSHEYVPQFTQWPGNGR